MRSVNYVELYVPYCNLTYSVPPCTAGELPIAGSAGALIGNLGGGGGLDAAFDNTPVKVFSLCATRSNWNVDGVVGKDWGEGVSRIVKSVTVTGPSDRAMARNASDVATSTGLQLQGSNNGTTWANLGGATTTGTTNGIVRTITPTSTTAYRYHQVRIVVIDGSTDMGIAAADFVETVVGEKCFNTKATCQAPLAYDEGLQVIRFAIGADFLRSDIECFPCIEDIDFTPGKISLGSDLGERSVLRVVLKDGKHSDTGDGFDKYWMDRNYDPYEHGTLFGKLRARQKYLRGRSVVWYQGTADQTLAEMELRVYIIDSVDGPNEDGLFTIIAKDPLKLLDGDRAEAPTLSPGYLASDITEVATAATLAPVGIGAQYAASGHICIGGNEVCSFTRAGDNLTLGRHALGSIASAHNAQDRVQTVLRFVTQSPAAIIQTLETAYAGVPGSFINLTEWQQEIDAYSGQVFTLNITEPTSVKQLVGEIIQSAGLIHYWDDKNLKLRLKVVRPIDASSALFTAETRLRDSLNIADQPDKRISRVQVFFGQIDPTKGTADPNNFRTSVLIAHAEAEANYGNVVIKTIYSRCIPPTGGAIATQLGSLLLSRVVDAPRLISFVVPRVDVTPLVPVLGDGYRVASKFLQDAYGAETQTPIQVIKLSPGPTIRVEAEEMLFSSAIVIDTTQHTVIVAAGPVYNFNLRTKHDATYPPAVAGDTVTCIINAGVIVGSTSTAPAFNVGNWPAGVTVNVVVNGRIQGMGGTGGRGGYRYDGPGTGDVETDPTFPGLPGGDAFKTLRAVGLSGSGEIWSGGGGGGGGAASVAPAEAESVGGGGGGGQGQTFGKGAAKKASGRAGFPGTSETFGDGGPGVFNGKRGGHGGAEGQAGQAGIDSFGADDWDTGGAGGATGNAIDGDSFVTQTGTLDVKGPRIN